MRIPFRYFEISPFQQLILLLLAFSSCLHSQPQENAKPVSDIKEILALAAQSRTIMDHQQVFRRLNALNPADRKSALEQLIGSPNDDVAAEAARVAVTEHDLDSAPLVAAHIVNWRPTPQLGVLQALVPLEDAFQQIPRRLVNSILEGVQRSEQSSPFSDPAGAAALLLARKPDQADRQMLLALAKVRSRSWGVWMAIANARAMDVARVELATRVYTDPAVASPTRVAAAVALEPFDNRATGFAVAQVQSFLEKFGNNDMGQMLVDAHQKASDALADGQVPLSGYAELRTTFHLLSAMLVLKAEAAHELTFGFLKATNGEIRIHCGIVAALRWPDELVRSGQGLFSDSEYANLMALVVKRHPNQSEAASVRITPARMAAASSRIDLLGLGVFGSPGTILGIF